MPLPMPRSVICSPSHMMKLVPVVSVSTHMMQEAPPGVVDERQAGDLLLALEVESRCRASWTIASRIVR
jgi:hypothetical protein